MIRAGYQLLWAILAAYLAAAIITVYAEPYIAAMIGE